MNLRIQHIFQCYRLRTPRAPPFQSKKAGLLPSQPLCRSLVPTHRPFTTTSPLKSWLIPKKGHSDKNRKGRCRVPTGGSTRGTTVIWGDYGLRLKNHDRRIPSKNLQLAHDTIKKRMRGERYKFYTRVAANTGVYTKGNEMRMGKGKGSFDHWAARVAVSQIVFEMKGACHEQVIRDALRLAGTKLPGTWEFVKKGDPPVMGLTKVTDGITLAGMPRPRPKLPADVSPERLPASVPSPQPDLATPPPAPSAQAPP